MDDESPEHVRNSGGVARWTSFQGATLREQVTTIFCSGRGHGDSLEVAPLPCTALHSWGLSQGHRPLPFVEARKMSHCGMR